MMYRVNSLYCFFLKSIALRIANENMDRLMTRLQLLSLAIGKLSPSVEDDSQGNHLILVLQIHLIRKSRIQINKIKKLRAIY